MARTYYFQLQPEGLGTPEAECLASYLHRLAAYHGVTLHQLIEHLRAWEGWSRFSNRILPKNCESGRFNGYSSDTDILVKTLDHATGLNCLRACTLLSLRSVAAGNGVGAIKQSRAWCPACYANADACGLPIYDRQAWQIVGVETCQTHHIPLVSRCWSCGCIQRSQTSKTTLSRCEVCEAILSKSVAAPVIGSDTRYTLRHVASFIAYISSRPDFQFKTGKLTTFCDLMVERYSRRKLMDDLGDVFHRRRYNVRPTLRSLLDLSTYFDIPLTDLLISPTEAAAQIALGFDPVIRKREHRPRARKSEKLDLAVLLLRRALSAGPPYPSVPSICAEAGVCFSYVHNSASDLTDRLVKLRKKSKAQMKLRKMRKITGLLQHEEKRDGFTTERDYIAWIASRAGASISQVRQVYNARKA